MSATEKFTQYAAYCVMLSAAAKDPEVDTVVWVRPDVALHRVTDNAVRGDAIGAAIATGYSQCGIISRTYTVHTYNAVKYIRLGPVVFFQDTGINYADHPDIILPEQMPIMEDVIWPNGVTATYDPHKFPKPSL